LLIDTEDGVLTVHVLTLHGAAAAGDQGGDGDQRKAEEE
jgi:hypothetical protein